MCVECRAHSFADEVEEKKSEEKGEEREEREPLARKIFLSLTNKLSPACGGRGNSESQIIKRGEASYARRDDER